MWQLIIPLEFVSNIIVRPITLSLRLFANMFAVVYTWPGGVVSLWPVPMAEESKIACWKSVRSAYELSKKQWVQLCWNSDRRD